MLISSAVFGDRVKYWNEDDYEDSPEHAQLRGRLCKTLYYGRMPSMDRPSLALTEVAVEVLQDVAPKELGRVDIDWASAVSREALISPTSLVLGMNYAKRLKKKDSSFRHRISSSDLFLVSVMMASKFLYDEGEDDGVVNDEWAASAHMDVKDLNELERNFLAAMDWELFVNSEEFWASLAAVEQQIAWKQGSKRAASFTYTDLTVLADSALYRSLRLLLLEMCKVVVVCTVAYTASLAVLIAVQPAISLVITLYPIYAAHLPYSHAKIPSVISIPAIQPSTEFPTLPLLPETPASVDVDSTHSARWMPIDFFRLLAFTESVLGAASSFLFPSENLIPNSRASCCCCRFSAANHTCRLNSTSHHPFSASSGRLSDNSVQCISSDDQTEERLRPPTTVSHAGGSSYNGNGLVCGRLECSMASTALEKSTPHTSSRDDRITSQSVPPLQNLSHAGELFFGFRSVIEAS